jgi:hypothetical protein
MKLNRVLISSLLFASVLLLSGCIKYSFSGASTTAKSIQVDDFFNNTELAPANFGQTVTNRIKDYFQQNSSLRVVPTNGELQIEGTIVAYSTAPQSPQASTGTGVNQTPNYGAQTRLTITLRVNYNDNADPKHSFKDRPFTFYTDFDNDSQNFVSIQESLEKKILDQIMLDLFNATIATW